MQTQSNDIVVIPTLESELAWLMGYIFAIEGTPTIKQFAIMTAHINSLWRKLHNIETPAYTDTKND